MNKTMNQLTKNSLAIITSYLLLVGTAYAHDPSLHKKDTPQKPQCEAMSNMDNADMDMTDPIMQAMMKQCTAKDSQVKTEKMTEHDQTEIKNHEEDGNSN